MKNVHILIIFFLALLYQQTGVAQIPNSSFENWTGGNPDGWTTNNIAGYLELVTQSSDAHTGSSAAKMEMMYGMSTLLQPVLNAGPLLVGIPVSERHSTINFYCKYTPTTSSVYLLAVVGMYKSGNYIGGTSVSAKNSISSYTKLSATISYFNQNVPDMANIYITLVDSLYNQQSVGTIALIDDIYFDQPNYVDDKETYPDDYSLYQNYPNPFNPSTSIQYAISSRQFVSLKVFDILGNEIETLVNEEKSAGTYEVTYFANGVSARDGYASGVYFYQLRTGEFTAVKKMILIK